MNQIRFPDIAPDDMTPQQSAVAAEIAAGPRGSVKGPFLPLMHHPELARRLQRLGEHLRFGTGLPPELIELAVLLVARHWQCQYEWFAHARIARETTSLPPSVIDAIARGDTPPGMSAEQAEVHRFCSEVLRSGEAGDASFAAVLERYGRQGALDLIALCGYYSLLAMVLNTARVPLPAGVSPPLPPLPGKTDGG
ncbi:carboxymuconolactone decarboxylase family protein [Verticiella sediminum]|uniref:Carboxymuconolactone decarboxylase family protein n=1 Tax=Verticiella sediminum TaxID=1247510 RepID=A0A556AJG1_9BURK|nr:carboxymuconolactone decarboxylase family protein [Verticiella sediminum]TSH93016.1 carboxymuconolactone decarboxylase family protein [Verticiella sediminum]